MLHVRQWYRPFLITIAVVVADVSGRLALRFDIARVLLFETILFAASSLLFLWAARRDRMLSRTTLRIDLSLALLFALGSLRAALWSIGVPVNVANLVVLLATCVIVIVYIFHRKFRVGPL